MQTTPEIDFQGMEASPQAQARIARQIDELETRFGRVTACRIVVKAPSARHHTGGQYEINIRLALPDGREAIVERTPPQDERYQDFDFALNDAFKRARRRLQDQVRRLEGHVKQHAEPALGVVRRLMREDGYGFLEGEDGQELYFHRNSVEGAGFDALERGDRVRYVPEDAEDGPQASAVRPLGERAPS
ncbi:putative cold-shock DNA-binding protein [Methylosinus sp. sav-2]|uniref:cold shock domain-containing protein n=1 Tax=unclassified Methylosinus TaxID=2624500 RepID=UPI000463E054|nr:MULTISPECIES: cold shock domain-containing protein [unclassified Methylosinus]TDX67269.1 putative cold-shock DNA-binding protein [Methylosinus sp. sav-2]